MRERKRKENYRNRMQGELEERGGGRTKEDKCVAL